jgi:hypothetical protein
MTAEHPILFSTPMVRAILEGRKTQTRRVVSRANSLIDGSTPKGTWWNDLDFDEAWVDPGPSPAGNRGPYLKVPYPGLSSVHRIYPRRWAGDRLWVKETFQRTCSRTIYKADTELHLKWTPSIFMHRVLSRINLEVTSVRVERVQEITEMDHEAEGLGLKEQPDAFRALWDKLNGKKAPWSSNPWVWVLEFRRLQ